MAKISTKYIGVMILSAALLTGCGRSFITLKQAIDPDTITMFGKNAGRDFYYNRSIGDSLALKYEFETKGSSSTTSPAAGNEFLFVPDLAGRVYGYDLNIGKKIGYISEKGAVYSSPIIDNSLIVIPVVKSGGEYTNIIIYNLNTGKIAKDIEVKGALKAEPVKVDNGFIFVSEEGVISRYNYNAYREWELYYGEFINSSPAVWNGLLLFGDFKGNVAAVNTEKGNLVYKNKIGGAFLGGFTVSGGKAYAGDAAGKLYCFDPATGKIIWNYDTKYSIEMFPAVAGDAVIIGNLNGDIYKLKAVTGELVWKTQTKGILNATPAVFNDYIVQPDLDKKVYLINTATGEIHKTLEYENRVKLTPMFYNGYLILGTDNGRVLVYETL